MDIESLFHSILAQHRAGALEAARSGYRLLLALDPVHADGLHNLAMLEQQSGQDAHAGLHFVAALRCNMSIDQYWFSLVDWLDRTGQHDRARAVLEDAAGHGAAAAVIEVKLRRSLVHHPEISLLASQFSEGRYEVAAEGAGQLIDGGCLLPYVWKLAGTALKLLGRSELAQDRLQKAAILAPGDWEIWTNLGGTQSDAGKMTTAQASFERALRLNPLSEDAHSSLAAILYRAELIHAAARHCRVAISLRPDHAEAFSNLATIRQSRGDLDMAAACFSRALRLKPRSGDLLSNMGLVLFHLGRFPEATSYIERAIALAPNKIRNFYNLSEVVRFQTGDRYLTAMEALLPGLEQRPLDEQADLHFALAKAYHDIGERDRGFVQLVAGNKAKRQLISYNEAATMERADRIEEMFDASFIAQRESGPRAQDAPIFILGMPRSGTSLIEQILASHPDVTALGELETFRRSVAACFPGTLFPDMVAGAGAADLERLGYVYLADIRDMAPEALRFTDKMPQNFLFCGLIHLALPRARMIHLRRDPVDTCLSCFSKQFSEGHPYCYDLGELGRYYRRYQRLMSHWHRVLPEGAILDIQYEDVVDDLETQARRLITFCGLDWHDACLDFHKTDRQVRTASATQVRQPIYRTSVGRWRPGGDKLDPLIRALEPLSDGATDS